MHTGPRTLGNWGAPDRSGLSLCRAILAGLGKGPWAVDERPAVPREPSQSEMAPGSQNGYKIL